ncbi:MAG: exodeoxyribonuclease V subunit alpha [Desulfobulbaceae bacterium]|nr:MAG: exodeoxyribonuclease V subunit alpha [Desulfobulbaceae bacterium]
MSVPIGFEENPLSHYFADFIEGLAAPHGCAQLGLVAELLSRARAEGHICLDLREVAPGSEYETLRRQLLATPVVGEAGRQRPLIIDGHYLYLHRYHRAEAMVADFIRHRQAMDLQGIDPAAIRAAMARLFPAPSGGDPDWQQVAALAALTRKFTVVSGGPGTGKTTTVAKILALFLELHSGRQQVIRLAAPTGKAAARLQQAIITAKGNLPLSAEVRQALPHETVTIHRLLGLVGGRPRHDEAHPLVADLVVIDEASMVDLPLMAQLMAALPSHATLILLGDHFQLASVQPGAVLGDICRHGQGFSDAFRDMAKNFALDLADTPPARQELADAIVTLQTSYRFKAESGIRRLSQAVKEGDFQKALAVLADPGCPDVELVEYGDQCHDLVEAQLVPGFAELMAGGTKEAQLDKLAGLGVLCAHRRGMAGMEEVNKILVDRASGGTGLMPYAGLPVMISRNSYGLQLYNGDTGVVVEEQGRLQACFAEHDGVRLIPARRLPPYDPAYAMTIHKSQGSEFDRVVVLLPPKSSAILGRELLYTALTRARYSVQLWGSEEVLRQAVTSAVRRVSGLAGRLWSGRV